MSPDPAPDRQDPDRQDPDRQDPDRPDGSDHRPAPGGYPVVLELTGRSCLVVGGGPVGARRARGLAAAGALVTVVAPRTVAAIDDDPVLVVERRPYRPGEAAGFHLVVTATGDPDVDRVVVGDAVAAGVLVGSADRTVPGTIQLPAVHRDGPVTVAVSTGGAQPGPDPVAPLQDRLVPPGGHGGAGRAVGPGPPRPAGGRPSHRLGGLAADTRRGAGPPGRGGTGGRGAGGAAAGCERLRTGR